MLWKNGNQLNLIEYNLPFYDNKSFEIQKSIPDTYCKTPLTSMRHMQAYNY